MAAGAGVSGDPARFARRFGLALEYDGATARLRSRILDECVEVAVDSAASALPALAAELARLQAHPEPQSVRRRGENFVEYNSARAARTTCRLGHQLTTIARQRRCLICAAAYRRMRRTARKADPSP